MKRIIILSITILLTTLNINSQCNLPTSIPLNQAEIEIANRKIAECYAPTIHQMADAVTPKSLGGRADLLVSAFYDDADFTNNWDSLSLFTISELQPHVYYSVVWTEKAWVVTYGFYHPRDYAPVFLISDEISGQLVDVCCADNHEHDFEGVIFVINRSSLEVQAAASISHFQLFLEFQNFGSNPPQVFIDDRTHAVRTSIDGQCIDEDLFPLVIAPCDDCKKFTNDNHIVYSYNGGSQTTSISQSGGLLTGTATYALEEIFSPTPFSLSSLQNNSSFFTSNTFTSSGTAGCQDAGSASAPWGWSQYGYSDDEIFALVCASTINGFTLVGNSLYEALSTHPTYDLCNEPFFASFENTIIHNPYTGPYVCNDPNATCSKVTNLQVSNLQDTQITFSWDSSGSVHHDYRYKKIGDLAWTVGSISSTSITLQNLEPMSFYTFEVRVNCNDCYSTISFQTPCSNSSPCDACFPSIDKIIDEDQTLIETEISGNLIVKNGNTLTIKSNVQFSEESQLIIEPGAKVIIDAATLSKCPSASSWKGVHLQSTWAVGFTPHVPGEIEMINRAAIQDAEIGIDAKNNIMFYGWSLDYGGGIVSMDQSFIQNCTKGIQLASYGWSYITGYGTPDDQSNILSSFIENCDYGIYADGNIGVEVMECRFQNNGVDIQSYESSFHLESNHFHSGVRMESDMPFVLGSNIISNTFYVFDMIVLSQGNFEAFNFLNNKMLNGSGFWIEGDLDFMAVKNDFSESIYGCFTYESGDNQSNNEVRDNYFLNNLYGNVAVGTNGTEYLSNCFDNSGIADIEVNDNASIRLVQGNEVLRESAGNCFENSTRIITGSSSVPFDYWTKDGFGIGNNSNCKYPGNDNVNNFTSIEADEERPADDCGSNLIGTGNPTSSFAGCDCDTSKENECKDEITAIRLDIEALENDASINFWIKRKEIAKLRRCLDRLIKKYVRYLLETKKVEEAISLLSNQTDLRYRAMAYTLILKTFNYNRARTYITNLSASTQEEIDFKAVQHINLDYLMDRNNYSLSINDKSDLYIMGKRSNPTSGYARSLYHRLTGELIKIDYQHINNTVSPKTRNFIAKEEIEIFPNPAPEGIIQISLDRAEALVNYSVNVYDMLGKRIITQGISSGLNKINIGYVKGILIFTIVKNGKIIKTERIVNL